MYRAEKRMQPSQAFPLLSYVIRYLATLKAGWQPWRSMMALDVCGNDLIEDSQIVRVMGLTLAADENLVCFS